MKATVTLSEREITLLVNAAREAGLQSQATAAVNREDGNASAADAILELAAEFFQVGKKLAELPQDPDSTNPS